LILINLSQSERKFDRVNFRAVGNPSNASVNSPSRKDGDLVACATPKARESP
jgi:hypothetical protein